MSWRRESSQSTPSWYEAQDLEVLKAWSNEIMEIQPEISMFGSLKTIDVSTEWNSYDPPIALIHSIPVVAQQQIDDGP